MDVGVVTLRPIRIRDARAWSAIRLRDRALLQPWEPTVVEGWRSRHQPVVWLGIARVMRAEARAGRLLPFVIEVDGRFAGQLTIGNLVRGSLRSAWVGYWVDSRLTGHGVATAALALGMDHGFGPVRLHRFEATVRPENAASRAVLAAAGFREEGRLQRYLDVDGAWRDHLLLARTTEEVRGSVSGELVQAGRARWA